MQNTATDAILAGIEAGTPADELLDALDREFGSYDTAMSLVSLADRVAATS